MPKSDDIRKDFKIFNSKENAGLIYFDNAATTQKPDCVIEAVADYYAKNNANPLRGLYGLSVRATDALESARRRVATFIGAHDPHEIVFTRNATESLNLVAYTLGMQKVEEGDEIVVSAMEHHSNILPWQRVARAKGARLVWLECTPDGVIPDDEIRTKITAKTKLVAVTEVSNVLGCTNDVKKITAAAHAVGAYAVIDGAQSAPHIRVNVSETGADFFAFSGHKLCAPMGIGVLYGKQELLDEMPPFMLGGEMISYVTREGATFANTPHKFEAGTINVGGAVGLSAAIDYVEGVGFDFIKRNDEVLSGILIEGMKKIPHVHIVGSDDPAKRCGIITFTVDGVHPHDVSTVLDSEGVAVRAGNHCAAPLMESLGLQSTARASVYFYNTEEEAELFLKHLSSVRRWMGFKE